MAQILYTDLPQDEAGNPVITVDDPAEQDVMPPYQDTSTNLVEDFMASEQGKKALEEIANDTCRKFDEDWDGQSKYRDWWKRTIKLLVGDLPKKTFPWDGAANCHVPILLENAMRLTSRIGAELFGDYRDVFGVAPVGQENENEAEILTLHGNWQIREQLTDFPREMDRCLLQFILGDVTCRSYWDPLVERNRHRMLTPDEFVTPFTFVSTEPDYGDLPHYTMVLRYYRHQLQAMRDDWVGVDEVLEQTPAGWDDPDMPGRQGIAEVQGEDVPSDLSQGAPYTLLHWEGWLELPLQQRDRWCQVVVDKCTKRVLCLKIHEEADWQDRVRFEQQTAEMSQYVGAMGQYQAGMGEIAANADQMLMLKDAGQLGVEQEAAMNHSLLEAAQMQEANRPPPPMWLADPEDLTATPDQPKTRPILMFAHGVCQEPLTGTLGLGVGRVLADYNRGANTALSQFTDAATLANCSGLIVADTVDFDRPFSWRPGAINKVKGVSGQELKNAVMPFQPGAANNQLLQLVQLMQSNGQAAAQAPDVLSGDPGKSGETYRGIATRIEQATKQLTVVGRRFAQFVRTVLRNNAKLNAVFLREEEIFEVTKGATATMSPMKVTRAMYQRSYNVEIRSDMRFAGDAERTAEADQVAQMGLAFPPLMQDMPFMYQALKRCLEVRKMRHMIPYLGPDPGLPALPFGMMPPAPMLPPGGGPPAQGTDGPPAAPNNPQGPGGPAPGAPPPEPQPQQGTA